MPLWLRRDIAVNHPCAIDKILVATGLVKSLTEARRNIETGAIYLNNEKLVPPEKGFLPVISPAGMRIDEFIALGINNELAAKILEKLRDLFNPVLLRAPDTQPVIILHHRMLLANLRATIITLRPRSSRPRSPATPRTTAVPAQTGRSAQWASL